MLGKGKDGVFREGFLEKGTSSWSRQDEEPLRGDCLPGQLPALWGLLPLPFVGSLCASQRDDLVRATGWLAPGASSLTGCCPLQDWPFDDGAPPPGKVVEDWLSLLKAKFCDDPGSCVAVHCVAGLGR